MLDWAESFLAVAAVAGIAIVGYLVLRMLLGRK